MGPVLWLHSARISTVLLAEPVKRCLRRYTSLRGLRTSPAGHGRNHDRHADKYATVRRVYAKPRQLNRTSMYLPLSILADRSPVRSLTGPSDTSHTARRDSVEHSYHHIRRTNQNQYGASPSTVPQTPHKPVTLEDIRSSVGDVFGARSDSVSDGFCARLIATQAFSLEFVTSTLRLLGVTKLLPLSFREVAARSQTCSAFIQQLQVLRMENVHIAPSIFSTCLQRVAVNANQDLFDYMVQSDRHPETYQDIVLQQKLLDNALIAGSLAEAHAILAIVAISGQQLDSSSWNRLLQAHCRSREPAIVKRLIGDMLVAKVAVCDKSLQLIRQTFLPARRKGKRPTTNGAIEASETSFVSDLQMSILYSSCEPMDPSHWFEILRRYGMTGRLDILCRLCCQLAAFYSTDARASVEYRAASCVNSNTRPSISSATKQRARHALATLFKPSFQRALVGWGFLSVDQRPASYRRGLDLLKHLAHSYGVVLDVTAIRRELRLRFRRAHATSPKAPAEILGHRHRHRPK